MKDFGFRILAYSGSVFMSINIKVVVFLGGRGGGLQIDQFYKYEKESL